MKIYVITCSIIKFAHLGLKLILATARMLLPYAFPFLGDSTNFRKWEIHGIFLQYISYKSSGLKILSQEPVDA